MKSKYKKMDICKDCEEKTCMGDPTLCVKLGDVEPDIDFILEDVQIVSTLVEEDIIGERVKCTIEPEPLPEFRAFFTRVEDLLEIYHDSLNGKNKMP